MIALSDSPIDAQSVIAAVAHPSAGAIDLFVGAVRDESDGHAVTLLEYEAYESMALKEMKRIALAVEAETPGVRVAVVHRVGSLRVGEAAVICAASAPHRAEAFRACRQLIDQIKAHVPIWKREHGPDGPYWVGWRDARCETDGHAHSHA